MPIDEKLLEILACPKCKGDIKLKEDESGLVCETCKLVYPIKDEIPIMLLEEAKSFGETK
ncbi:Trm112 family protein [Desulfobacterota bacterium AH_259_B03_O07]|nr:Trm112 family protein [Desulfobacterota bacterium AH_259_B03_O07]